MELATRHSMQYQTTRANSLARLLALRYQLHITITTTTAAATAFNYVTHTLNINPGDVECTYFRGHNEYLWLVSLWQDAGYNIVAGRVERGETAVNCLVLHEIAHALVHRGDQAQSIEQALLLSERMTDEVWARGTHGKTYRVALHQVITLLTEGSRRRFR